MRAMNQMVDRSARLALALALAASLATSTQVLAQRQAVGARFTVSFPASAHTSPITGRVYVAISKTNDRSPIQQADTTGVPLFGVNVEAANMIATAGRISAACRRTK